MRIAMVLLCTLLTLPVGMAAQPAVVSPAKDNTLYETANGSTSNGAGDYIFVGTTNGESNRRGLIKFDIAAGVPAGATVTAVSLRMNVSKVGAATATNVVLKRITADWGEGTSNAGAEEGQGGAAATGDATWLHRFSTSTLWTIVGGDFSATESGVLSVGGTGVYTWTSTAQLVADVQSWLNDPSSNFGWILIGNESITKTSKRFDSREHPTSANRPQLTVNYTASTGVGDEPNVPAAFELRGNHPNPFNPSTQISYSLPVDQPARLTIYNLLGVKMATLVDRQMTAGQHMVTWNAAGIPSGMYFARLESGGMSAMKRMILTK
jgi:hypothetical protein